MKSPNSVTSHLFDNAQDKSTNTMFLFNPQAAPGNKTPVLNVVPGEVIATTYAVAWDNHGNREPDMRSSLKSNLHRQFIYVNPFENGSGASVPAVLKMAMLPDMPTRKLSDAIEMIASGEAKVLPSRTQHLTKPYGMAVNQEQLMGLIDLMGLLWAVNKFGVSTYWAELPDDMVSFLKNNPPESCAILSLQSEVPRIPTASAISQALMREIKRATHRRIYPDKMSFFGVFKAGSFDSFDYAGAIEYGRNLPGVLAHMKTICPDWFTEETIRNFPTAPAGEWINYLTRILSAYKRKLLGMDTAQPASKGQASSPRAKRKKPEREAPPALFAGLTADEIVAKVNDATLKYFSVELEGPARIAPEVRTLYYEPKLRSKSAASGVERLPRVVELETLNTGSNIAVMDFTKFSRTIDSRRHPAMQWLERNLGRELNFDRAYTVDITPARLAEIPALVAGLHRQYPDRLCLVRLILPCTRPASYEERKLLYADYRAFRKEKRKPLHTVKIKEGTKNGKKVLKHQKLFFADPQTLAFFPAAWLAETPEWWVAGLFGTPYDPALADFCADMPQAWQDRVRSILLPPDPQRRTLDIRALTSATPAEPANLPPP